MNKSLFLSNIRANWGIFAFVAGMLLIYVSTAVSMYDPMSIEAMESMFNLLPEGMLKAFGFDNLGTDLAGYLAHYFYGFIIIVFPMIYIVLISNRLIAKHVDTGSMAYLLTTPNTRVRIAMTQAIYLLASIFALLVIDVGILILLSVSSYPGLLDIGPFLGLNLVTFLVLATIGGIGFFFSCLFSDSRRSLAFGGGIPVAFIVLKMVGDAGSDLGWMRYFTIFTVLDIDRILEDPMYVLAISLILIAAIIVLFGTAIRIFDKKSLAI